MSWLEVAYGIGSTAISGVPIRAMCSWSIDKLSLDVGTSLRVLGLESLLVTIDSSVPTALMSLATNLREYLLECMLTDAEQWTWVRGSSAIIGTCAIVIYKMLVAMGIAFSLVSHFCEFFGLSY